METIDKIISIKKQYIEKADNITEQDLENCKLLTKQGKEYFLPCKSFNVFINVNYFFAILCEGQTPISQIYLRKSKDLDLLIQVLKENKEIA